MRQIISTGIYSKEEIINHVSSTIAIADFNNLDLNEIYSINNRPVKRYIPKIIKHLF